jgi:hypothetical protein
MTPMFALVSKLSRSRKAQTIEPSMPAARAAAIDTLEDRRLYAVSPVGPLSFSFGESQGGTMAVQLPAVQKGTTVSNDLGPDNVQKGTTASSAPRLLLPAVQQPGETNIIAVLIAL